MTDSRLVTREDLRAALDDHMKRFMEQPESYVSREAVAASIFDALPATPAASAEADAALRRAVFDVLQYHSVHPASGGIGSRLNALADVFDGRSTPTPDAADVDGRRDATDAASREALRVAISRLAVGDPEYPLSVVLALAAPSTPTTEGLDVERLAEAMHGWKQCDFGYCEGRDDHIDDARGVAAEYQRLSEPE